MQNVLRPHPKRGRDWFIADEEVAKPLLALDGGVPGVTVKWDGSVERPAMFEIHRSHLPLCTAPDAIEMLARMHERANQSWDVRNARTEALGITLRTTQHQAIDYITDRAGTLLGDDMRLGKGHPHGTRVLTPYGWRAIEELRIGDAVIGSSGTAIPVMGVFPRGVLPVYRVGFSDGSSVRVDGEHLWAAWSHNDWHRGNTYRVKPTSELIGDLQDGAGNNKWRIPLVRPIEFDPVTLPIDPYLLGVLLGDGCLSNFRVDFCCGDEDVPREVRKVLPPGSTLKAYRSEDRAPTWHVFSQPVWDALKELHLLGTRSFEKFVPDRYLFASSVQRLALLQGLLDTDGEYCDGILAFSSSSEQLRDSVRFLVESLGGVARASVRATPKYTYQGEECIGRPSYRLTIAMPIGMEPFRARTGYKQRKKFGPTRHIRSIEPDGEAEVTCISVGAADRLYVTEHCIVTHNTLSAACSHDPKDGSLVVVAPLSARGVWLSWLRRVFPGEDIGVMAGKKFDRAQASKPIVFGHYDILAQWQTIMPIGTLVFDEAHNLTNRRTKRTEAAFILRARARRVIAMTGTPIWNMPPDLWAVLALVAPGAWGSYYDFGDRYGAPEPTAYGKLYTGASNTEELRARMTEVMLRRRWRDCMADLPPIQRTVHVVEVNDIQRKKLDIVMGSLRTERTNTASHLAQYRREVSFVKTKLTCERVQKHIETGNPVVVWTWHKELADRLASMLDAFVIHGDIAPNKRDEIIDQWKASPTPRVLVATWSVGQVAIDLSHAPVAIAPEIDWTPAIIGQGEMRIFSPLRPMLIEYIIVNHIVEQRMVRALIAKLGAADPLGVGAAVDTIDALRDALLGPQEAGDLDRLMEDLLASAA